MLSISFGEILLIATVGLVVIGPKRLPQAARFVGHLFGRMQRQIRTVKDDIKREMDAADMQSIREEYQKAAQKAGESAGDIFQSVKQTAAEATGDINNIVANNQTTADDKNSDNKTGDNKTADDNNADNKNADDKNADNQNTFPPPHTAPASSTKQTDKQ